MKMTNGQKYIADQIRTQLEKYIKEYTDKINAVTILKFYPKKDGTEKANFALNFGTDHGEKYTINWGHTKEDRRCVTITQKFNYSGEFQGVEFSTASVWDENHEKQIIPFTSHSVWFNWNIFESCERPKTAKDTFSLIKGPYCDYLRKTLREYKNTLDDFDHNFEQLCIAATNLQENIKGITAPVFCSYAYNLQGRDNHYLASNYFED